MSTTSAPYGLKPIRHINGKFVPSPRAIPGGIVSGYSGTIQLGDPVLITSAGVLNIAATTGDFYGVFAGCQYVPNATGLLTPTNQWTGSTTYVAGTMIAYVWEDPGIIYQIQSSGSIAAGNIGNQANITNLGVGNFGQSAVQISSSLAGNGSQAQLRIVGYAFGINSLAGDAFTDVEVQIAQQQYTANKVAI